MTAPNDLPIKTLIQQCIKGDKKAQRLLFQKYREIFLNLAYKSLGPAFDIDEVVHEIFIQVFNGLPSFKGKSSFDTWAYRIGMNVCLSKLRKKFKKRKLDLVQGVEAYENKAIVHQAGPYDELASKELESKIFEALDRIDEKKRMVIVMHDMEGKTLEEIARTVGKPVGTIKSRLFHGRNEMKKILKKYIVS